MLEQGSGAKDAEAKMLEEGRLFVAANNDFSTRRLPSQWMWRHKSLGLAAGIILLPRLAIKLGSRIPQALAGSSGFEKVASKASHVGLYGFLTVMPLTGISMGLYGGKGLPFFFTNIPSWVDKNGTIAKYSFKIHKTMGVYGKVILDDARPLIPSPPTHP